MYDFWGFGFIPSTSVSQDLKSFSVSRRQWSVFPPSFGLKVIIYFSIWENAVLMTLFRLGNPRRSCKIYRIRKNNYFYRNKIVRSKIFFFFSLKTRSHEIINLVTRSNYHIFFCLKSMFELKNTLANFVYMRYLTHLLDLKYIYIYI